MSFESKTVFAMIQIYCSAHHEGTKGLCPECADLLVYAEESIENCSFGDGKPVCNQCVVHCYEPEMREQIKRVMRFSGPRMMGRHPILAIRHLVRSCRVPYSGIRSK